ncbi:MAG TPA: Xaa-Pro aminopeptidase [Chromatiaceae bacterium]|jgi:Xaa-Pro aminopeptidase|nr:Xaa-Pro aminopeptidase [Chromatiaceae bacterium]HIN81746.1 Xaa-Pro aminopeptidase [Chromatiales bacterium]HIA07862.1 Xaa-Pro aminopeptidase [Chromatiaceae bacterium]HIB84445.1 Xaa-Pro aminopeptidase [Chromatiaceae bacterium]HIO14971.1 Xaa-Pro aminopeptidase [Chromatiales bacterium]
MNMKELQRRRRQLAKMMGPDSIAIIPTAQMQIRNRDVEREFRPDSDFFYLTGFHEPESVAVLMPGHGEGEYLIFCRERDEQMETWTGRRVGPEGACEQFGADDAFPIDDIGDILPGLMEHCSRLWYAMGCNPEFDKRVIDWMNYLRNQGRSGVHAPLEIVALDHVLHDMRLYKSRTEVSLMRRAANISAKAHKVAMQTCQPGMTEYQLEAELLYQFKVQGAQSVAYSTIVGGGDNGCILHYTENSDELNDGDLVLIDAGCELDCYASDITRTWPVNGRFSDAQTELYEIVLSAQEAAFKQVVAGNTWNDPHRAAVKEITRGLISIGLLKGKLNSLIKDKAYQRFYMHRTGHWLGMDVHDVGDYKVGDEWRVLENGMALTVEPGLYIPLNAKGVAKRWRGIGIRIEDDVVVRNDDCDVLSKAAPKTIKEIEAVMAA